MQTEHLLSPDVLRADADAIRGRVFEFGGPKADQALYAYQVAALHRIESVAKLPRSGIVHFPTGAGKTRVGIEVIARALRSDPQHRFLWVTHSKNLIQQSMVRLAEMSGSFSLGTRFTWIDSPSDLASPHHPDVHVTFLTRTGLSYALQEAARTSSHPWRRQLSQGRPLTLIYDECHQLGAEELQRALEAFYVAIGDPGPSCPWRVVGLSATPIPTSQAAHGLLKRRVFPKVDPATCFDWPFYVFSRVSNATLQEDGVLCPISEFFDRHGGLDLPEQVLSAAIRASHLSEPGRGADPLELQRYARQFNRDVLASPEALRCLARNIGENIDSLRKTIVFLPTVPAANEFVANLYEMFPRLRRCVSAVHSRVNELPIQQVERGSVEAVLDHFRELGDQPAILANVDMLTEGFDDPKIQTVVLARLTLSANRFWQMIGRGTRGPKVGGTKFCYVVDPIKLTRLYDYFNGYQPSFDGSQQPELAEREAGDDDQGLDPPGGSIAVPGGTLPPDPHDAPYVADERLEKVNVLAARAIEQFLRGSPLAETDALEIARSTKLEVHRGRVVFVPSATEFDPDAAAALLVGEVSGLEVRHGVSLPWLRQKLVVPATAGGLTRWLRLLRTVESQRCWTRPLFDAAGLHMPAAQQADESTPVGGAPTASAQAEPVDDGGEAFLVDAGVAMAVADGKMTEPEVKAIAHGLFEFFGRPSTPELHDRIRAHRAPTDIASRVPARMPPAERVLRMLEGVAAADGIVSPEEKELLLGLAKAMGLSESFVKVELGPIITAGAARSTTAATATPAARVCWNCSFVGPATYAFCTNCGRSLDPATAGAGGSSTTSSMSDDTPLCREATCTYRALPGNYGFCGRHRATERRAASGSDRCKRTMQDGRRCPAAALPGNYGFCGRHR